MSNYEAFEAALRKAELDLEREDFGNRYGYFLRQSYDDFQTLWIIGVNHEGESSFHELVVNIMSISAYKLEETLKFLNKLNTDYNNATFFLYYNEEKQSYDIRLKRSYFTGDEDFNGETYVGLIYLTHQLLEEVVPKLIRLKYN